MTTLNQLARITYRAARLERATRNPGRYASNRAKSRALRRVGFWRLWSRFWLLLLAAAVFAGCAETDQAAVVGEQEGAIHVQAGPKQCWSGHVGDSSKEGCGAAEFDVGGKDEPIIVAIVQKKTPGTWRLGLSLEIDGKVRDSSETTAEYGVAQVEEVRE